MALQLPSHDPRTPLGVLATSPGLECRGVRVDKGKEGESRVGNKGTEILAGAKK